MNERIKQVRKELGLTLEDFGSRIGFTRSSMSNIETGYRNVTNRFVLAVCREFHVNEEWLRNGTGEMFVSYDSISLDDLVATNQVDEIELEILKAYFSLDPDIRRKAIQHFKSTLK